MKQQANVNLAAGAPFISNSEAQAQLEKAGVPADVQDDILTEYEASQRHPLVCAPRSRSSR